MQRPGAARAPFELCEGRRPQEAGRGVGRTGDVETTGHSFSFRYTRPILYRFRRQRSSAIPSSSSSASCHRRSRGHGGADLARVQKRFAGRTPQQRRAVQARGQGDHDPERRGALRGRVGHEERQEDHRPKVQGWLEQAAVADRPDVRPRNAALAARAQEERVPLGDDPLAPARAA